MILGSTCMQRGEDRSGQVTHDVFAGGLSVHVRIVGTLRTRGMIVPFYMACAGDHCTSN